MGDVRKPRWAVQRPKHLGFLMGRPEASSTSGLNAPYGTEHTPINSPRAFFARSALNLAATRRAASVGSIFRITSRSTQLRTRSFGTPPLRAISAPQCVRSRSEIEWATGLMLIMQPSSRAREYQRQSRSRRHRFALISTTRRCLAQAASHFLYVDLVPRTAQKLLAGHLT